MATDNEFLPMPIPSDDDTADDDTGLEPDEPPPPPDNPPPDNPPEPPVVTECNNACDAAEAAIDSAMQSIIVPMLTQLQTAENSHRESVSSILGSIDNAADKIATSVGKAYDKIERQLNGELGNAYGIAAQCGLQYPSPEQVTEGLQTGKCLETCGYQLTPPVFPTQPTPVNVNVTVPITNEYKPDKTTEGLGPYPYPGPVPPVQVPYLLSPPVPPQLDQPLPQNPNNIFVNVEGSKATASAIGIGGTATAESNQPQGIKVNYIPGIGPIQEIEVLPMPREVKTENLKAEKTDREKLIELLNSISPGLGDRFTPQEKEKQSSLSDPLNPFGTPDWNKLDACYELKGLITSLYESHKLIPINFGFEGSGKNKKMPQWFKGIYDNLPGIIDDAVFEFAKMNASLLWKLVEWGAAGSGCSILAMIPPAAISFIGGIISKWISSDGDKLTRPFQLTSNAICPQEIPTQHEANNAYLTGRIDFDTWQCWVRANNVRDQPYEKIMESNSARPNLGEWMQLRMRKHIGEQEWIMQCRNSGVILPGMREAFEKLVEAWPGMEDVVRFMVRDVDDEQLVQTFGMDDDFQHKWTGKTQDYGIGLGMTTDLAKRYWRAHWTIPSPTQLYEMFCRNRPGRVDPEAVVTKEEVVTALKQQDILPFWIEPLLAIAFNPLTRTDTQRAYFIDALSRQDVYESYRDERYSPDDAERLTKFTELLKRQYKLRQVGAPTPKQATIMYARNEISLNLMRTMIREYGLTEESVASAETTAGRIRLARQNRKRQQMLKKRLLFGDIEPMNARDNLIRLGYEPEQATNIIEEWSIELEGRIKAIPAAKICQMKERNLIDDADQLRMLVRLGYSPSQARLIQADCGATIESHKMRKLMDELKKIQKAQEQRQKEAARLQREAERSQKRRQVDPIRIDEKTAAAIESKIARERAEEALSSDPESESTVDTPLDTGE